MARLDYEYLSDLVVKTQAGNSDAFAELYAATYKKQYRFACQYLKDPYMAQDVLQDVYILVLKNIKKLQNPRLFVSWLNQICFRMCFDLSKKYSVLSQELDDSIEVDSEAMTCPGPGPEARVTRKVFDQQVMKAVLELPAKEAEAIVMKYYQEMKIEEIADAMDCSRASVIRYLSQGRQKLQSSLGNWKGGVGFDE